MQATRIPTNQPPASIPTSLPTSLQNEVMTNVNSVPIENPIKVQPTNQSQISHQPPAQANRQKRVAKIQDPTTLQEKDLTKLAELPIEHTPINNQQQQQQSHNNSLTQQTNINQIIIDNHEPMITIKQIPQVSEDQPIKQEVCYFGLFLNLF